jgi:hypothetical protein
MNRCRSLGMVPGLAALLAVGPAATAHAQTAGSATEPSGPVPGPSAPPPPASAAPPATSPEAAPAPHLVAPASAPAPGVGTAPLASRRRVTVVPPPDPITAAALAGPSRWELGFYGFAELNAMRDSTQSYGPAANNVMLARPGTYAAAFGRTQFTANNSQLGVRLAAPQWVWVKVSGGAELDFFGVQPTDVTEGNTFSQPSVRMRLFFMRLETPFVTLLAGQFHDLFGWGGAGFYPNTVAFLGVPGQLYHRNPQVRASRVFGDPSLRLEAAVAAVRPAQRNADLPDGQAGVRLSSTRWTGVAAQGFGQPTVAPAALGLSGVSRRFAVAEFLTVPGAPKIAYGWGLAANLFFPIIGLGARDQLSEGNVPGDLGNTLSLTAEFSAGSGISDLYTQLTGGALFPTLPNPGSIVPPPLYRPDIDSGIVTYDGNGNLSPIKWRAYVVGLQYHLPVAEGRLWVAATLARLTSSNLGALTPNASRGGVFVSADYLDGNVFFALTPSVQLAVSYQTTHQVFGDAPLGGQSAHGWTPSWLDWLPEGGKKALRPLLPEDGAAQTRNHRAELALKMYF